jgi:serine/threonine protein kinase/tetratricopeptide (TPR) repeat protein
VNELEIFSAALELADPDARQRFLNDACATRRDWRDRIEALLRNAAAESQFLESPLIGLGDSGDQAAFERPGTQLGPYTLVHVIGEGGMGVVYRAEQETPVRRHVALKIIKPGMDSRQVIARFEAERQALAIMDHPHIAKVLDGGSTASGRPYFVMELVKGVPITQYCDATQLTLRERLELFVPVCQAVQHAHQHGIVHRDLKPTNILVAQYDNRAAPKVIDFGVVKVIAQKQTTHAMPTEVGQVIGTLEYMSPEQAGLNRLDVDPRSDIYSLGALLYELITGQTPIDRRRIRATAFDEVLRMIREEDPPKPSTALGTGDTLPFIAANRHTEPTRLSRAVRGELDWIVMKCLEKDRTHRYQSAGILAQDIERYLRDEPVQACPPSRWYRLAKFARRHKVRLGTAGLAIFCLTLLCAGGGWEARQRSKREQRMATDARHALRESRRLYNESRYHEALAAGERAEFVLGDGGSGELRKEVRDNLADLKMVPRIEAVRLMGSGVKNGRFDGEAEDRGYADAFRDYGIDVDVLGVREAAARVAERTIRLELAAALDGWAQTRRYLRPPQARAQGMSWQDLVAVARAADPDGWRCELRDAVIRGDRQAPVRLARSKKTDDAAPVTLVLLAQFLKNAGEPAEAVALLTKHQVRHASDFWLNHEMADCLVKLDPPQWDKAVPFYTAAVALRPESPGARLNLGNALAAVGSGDAALATFRRAAELKPEYAEAYSNMGRALWDQGRYDEAIAVCRQALALKPDLAEAYWNLGGALGDQGRHAESSAACRQAIALRPTWAEPHYQLGNALLGLGELDGAIGKYRQAIDLKAEYPEAHCNLAFALERQGRLDAALEEYLLAISVNPKLCAAHHNLGRLLHKRGRLEEAAAAYRRVLEVNPTCAEAHYDLANALMGCGQDGDATAEYRQAIRCKPDFAEAYCNYAYALRRYGEFDEAIVCMERGHTIGSRRPDWQYPSARWVLEYRRIAELAPQLSAVLRGEMTPTNREEQIACAQLCFDRTQYGASARFWSDALQLATDFDENATVDYRYDAAAAATLAGLGRGADADVLDEPQRAHWRGWALAWLREDFHGIRNGQGPAVQRVQRWLNQPDLAVLRDPAAVAELPTAEQAFYKELWAEVQAFLVRVDAR